MLAKNFIVVKRLIIFILGSVFIQLDIIVAQIPIPQLKAGVYVNDSIYNLDIYLNACQLIGVHDVDVMIDSNLIPLASGVELKYVVTLLNTMPDSVYSVQSGVVHLYDTLTFSSNNTYFRFYSSVSGLMQLKLIIVGTPTVALESYPCELSLGIVLPNCMDAKYIYSSGTLCTVEDFNGIRENETSLTFKVSPIPANDYFEIQALSVQKNEKVFMLFNGQGQEVLREKMTLNFKSKRISIDNLANGIYFWHVFVEGEFQESGKLIVDRKK